MGTKNNPGEFDCYENADDDQPMFVLLAGDEDAPELVEDWCRKRLAKLLASDLSRDTLHRGVRKIAEALVCATAMREWEEDQPTPALVDLMSDYFKVAPLSPTPAEVDSISLDDIRHAMENLLSPPAARSAFKSGPGSGWATGLTGYGEKGYVRPPYGDPRTEPHPSTECGWRGCGGARQDRTDPEGGIPGRK